MQIKELAHILNEFAPDALAESYDNVGLLVGIEETEIKQVLCTLDCTEEVVKEAITKGCNLIIAHHPIIFSGLKSITGKTMVERTVMLALREHIAIYAMHTNLDHTWEGVNRRFGEQLGLVELKILSPQRGKLRKIVTFVPHDFAANVSKGMFEAGAGHIGEYDHCSYKLEGIGTFRGSEKANAFVGLPGVDHNEKETRLEMIFPHFLESRIISSLKSAHPYEEVAYDIYSLENTHSRIGSGMVGMLPRPMSEKQFFTHVGNQMHAKVIRHTALLNKAIQTVAICGGAGRFLLSHAMAQKADVLVTSDFKYHDFFDADKNIVVMDIGHFESEQFTPHIIRDFLVQKNVTFAVLLSEVNTNPIHYFIS